MYVSTPVFEGAREDEIKDLYWLRPNLPPSGQITLYDGKTGEPFQKPITVGHMYI